ncbi:MAG: MATE family efflux transporter [Tissierellaceae bacterium]
MIGQVVSSLMIVRYFFRFKTLKLTKRFLKIKGTYTIAIVSLGLASFFNQLAMTLVQITMNNTLTHYGAMSRFGSEIPLASVGIISKVNIVFMAFVIGTAIGCQPINGFNYGAKNYARVKKTYKTAVIMTSTIATAAFLLFQVFPRQIIGIFGQGSPEYFEFATRYMRIFMLLTFVNGIQPVTSSFFTSIGKATKGTILSLTRQIIFLLPLIIIFPRFFGVEGVMYAGPIADGAAALASLLLIIMEFRNMRDEEILEVSHKTD